MNRLLVVALSIAALGRTEVGGHAEIVDVANRGTAYSTHTLWGNLTIGSLNDSSTATFVHADTAPEGPLAYWLDLGANVDVREVRIHPRQDGCCPDRLTRFRVSVHVDDGGGGVGAEVWGVDAHTDGTNPGSAAGSVEIIPVPSGTLAVGRHVRILSLANPIPDYALQISEVQIFADVPASEVNRALGTVASSNRPLFGSASAALLVDGNRNSFVHGVETIEAPFFYVLNMGAPVRLNRIVIWARQDGCCPERLSNYRLSVHENDAGAIGDVVFQTVLHADGSNPGSEVGSQDVLTSELTVGGNVVEGQWLKIEALEDPIPSYALQIAEIEAYGETLGGASLLITRQPDGSSAGVGQPAEFSVAATVVNGDSGQIGYQWRRNGAGIPGATNATYTTPPVLVEDDKAAFTCVVSYPGLAEQVTEPAVLRVNLAFQASAYSNRPLWANGGWSISMITDGNRTAALHGDTDIEAGMAYEVNLGAGIRLDAIDIYPRQDGCCPERLTNFRVSVHEDNQGAIGDEVWGADLFNDGTNPGSSAGSVITVEADRDPSGRFEGQWLRILALDDPVPNYHLQMAEIEAFGAFLSALPKLEIIQQPADAPGAPGRTARLNLGARVLNGNPANIGYQWFRDGAPISGASSNVYVTPPLVDADTNAVFHCVVSYPGVSAIPSGTARVFFDYNYSRGQPAYSNRPLWGPGNWNIAMLVDGDRDSVFHADTQPGAGFAYDVDLGTEVAVERIDIYPRQDGCCPERLANFRLSLHEASGGVMGGETWVGDFFTDGSNAGSGEGIVVTIDGTQGAGVFKGSWVRILALDDPVPDYFLQMSELEVYGRATAVPRPTLAVARSATGLTLTWSAAGFVLQETDSLGAGAAWVNVPGGTTSPVTVPATSQAKYFRLRSP